MAISPSQAVQAQIASEADASAAAERVIDDGLRLGRRTFSLPKISPQGITALAARYRQLGWVIEEIRDQREGDYWHFKT